MDMAKKVWVELQELSSAVVQMIESFSQVRKPLKETTEHVPEAHEKLSKVTSTTEKATNEMLDTIDQMIENISNSQELVGSAREKFGDDEIFAKLEENFNANLEGAYSIMEALQFQDITSQQIYHIEGILNQIQLKLKELLKALGEADAQMTNTMEKAYNPDAEYERDPSRQSNIDEIISSVKKKESGGNKL